MSTPSTAAEDALGGLRDDASSIGQAASNRVHREVDARKGAAIEQVKTLSSALGSAADQSGQAQWLQSAFAQGARKLQQLAESVERKDSRQLSDDVRQLATANPAAFLGGCALAGFAAARVIKAGGQAVTPGTASPPRFATAEAQGGPAVYSSTSFGAGAE